VSKGELPTFQPAALLALVSGFGFGFLWVKSDGDRSLVVAPWGRVAAVWAVVWFPPESSRQRFPRAPPRWRSWLSCGVDQVVGATSWTPRGRRGRWPTRNQAWFHKVAASEADGAHTPPTRQGRRRLRRPKGGVDVVWSPNI